MKAVARASASGPDTCESQYRTLFECNPLPLWVYDVQTLRFLAVNDAACAKYGYTREEFLAMTLPDIRAPEDVPRLIEAIEQTSVYGVKPGLWKHLTKHGAAMCVETVAHALTWDGRAARVVCPLDVTERLAAETAARDAQIRYTALVDQSITGIYIIARSRITYANRKLCEIIGYSAEQLYALDLRTVFVEEDFFKVMDVLRRRKGGDKGSISFDIRARHSDGRVIHLSVESKVAEIGSRQIAMGVVRDVSPRIHAEEALRESELRFRQLAENINEVFFLQDPNTGQDLYLSPAYEEIWGRTRASHYANPDSWKDSVHRDDAADFEAQRTKSNFDHEFRILRPDGTLRWIRSRGFPIRDASGAIYRIAGVAEDITERKRSEEQVRSLTAALEQRVAERTEALAASNLELEAFDYSISHDLRSPLRHITGLSAALMADCADKMDAHGLELLHRLHASGKRMDRMVADLLALSTLTRGGTFPERTNASVLAESVVAELRRTDPGREVEVVIEPSIMVNADKGLLHIVLENLLGNAWKFTSTRADAKIAMGRRAASSGQEIFVRDNGTGFDMAFAGNLFAPFRRLHKEGEFNGTGIGLATVQRIVRLHGGRAWAEAAVGEGATFHFTLPDDQGGAP
jgi:PAS domain S-box-containing protein